MTEKTDTKPDWADEKAKETVRVAWSRPGRGAIQNTIAQSLRDEREACARVAARQKAFCQRLGMGTLSDEGRRLWRVGADVSEIIETAIRTRTDQEKA